MLPEPEVLPELELPPPLMTAPEPEVLPELLEPATVATGTYSVLPYLMLVRLVPLFRVCIRLILAL